MAPATGTHRRGRRQGTGLALALPVVVLVAAAALAVGARRAQASSLALDPASGQVGTSVTGSHPVEEGCDTFRLRWGGDGGEVLGQAAAGAGGTARVHFEVPPATRGEHQVVATCQPEDAEETVVGAGTFVVVGSPVPTVRPPTTSTTRPTTTTSLPDGTSPTTSPTSLPPPPAPEDFAECERRARQAQANLVYQPERTMTVGLTHPVVAVLALNPGDPGVTLPGPERTTVVTIPPAVTGCLMEASLIGPDFQVSPPEPQLQSFRDTTVLSWLWQVKPLREGPDLRLVLRLQPLFREEGQPPVPGQEQVFEAVIDVDAEPRSLWSKVGGWTSSFFGNEAVRYLLLPGGGGIVTLWLAQRWRGRRHPS